jgi:LemA protein
MVSDTLKIGIVIVIVAIVGIVGLIGLFYVGTYNGLVDKDVSIEKLKGDLSSQYQRRADLIPNLVATVQGSAQFEKSTQTEIAGLRSQAISGQEKMRNAKTVSEIQSANGELDSVLSRLMVVVEAYPTLQSNQNFRDLQSQLEGTENRINYARTEYNEGVETYKKSVRSFPTSIVANMNGFDVDKWDMFEAKPGSDVAPTVTFNI